MNNSPLLQVSGLLENSNLAVAHQDNYRPPGDCLVNHVFIWCIHTGKQSPPSIPSGANLQAPVTPEDTISLKICHVCVQKLERCNKFVQEYKHTESQRRGSTAGQNVCYLCLEARGVLCSLFDDRNWAQKIETALGCKKLPDSMSHWLFSPGELTALSPLHSPHLLLLSAADW
uniref:Uncharacterized protein n=1 Tax=Timema monikensis TaxID=170555 RepID=A0A7R9ED83_9NEOP|nr:unnamed protein product [Timema monikensis]